MQGLTKILLGTAALFAATKYWEKSSENANMQNGMIPNLNPTLPQNPNMYTQPYYDPIRPNTTPQPPINNNNNNNNNTGGGKGGGKGDDCPDGNCNLGIGGQRGFYVRR